MAKEYHPDTPQTIPHAALIHSERELNPDTSSYPSYLQRDDWISGKIAEHRLSLPEGAVLRRVSHYAGTAAGCWAGIDRIAADLGCHEKTVRRAIEVLLREGLVTQGGWRSRVRVLILALDTGLSARSALTPDFPPGLTFLTPGRESGLKRMTPDFPPGLTFLTPGRESLTPGRESLTPGRESD